MKINYGILSLTLLTLCIPSPNFMATSGSTCQVDGMGGSQPSEVCTLIKFLKALRENGTRKHGHNILLFVGKRDSGKTMGAEKIAQNSGVEYIKVSAKTLIKNHNGIAIIKKIFDDANSQNKPYIIIIDDIDGIDHQENLALITAINSHTQEAFKSDNLLVILTARETKNLDNALLNRCHIIEWELPNKEDRMKIFELYLKGKNHRLDQEALQDAAEQTNRFSAQDIQNTIPIAEVFRDLRNGSSITDEDIKDAITKKRPFVDEKNPSSITLALKRGGTALGIGFIAYRIYRTIKKPRRN